MSTAFKKASKLEKLNKSKFDEDLDDKKPSKLVDVSSDSESSGDEV